MNKSLLIAVLFVLLSGNSYAQKWKVYPYSPPNTLISFPRDEGIHPGEDSEWWYMFMKVKGQDTGDEYSIMFTFFHKDSLIFDGFRIFNVSNESTGEFLSGTKPLNFIKNATGHLEITANVQGHKETWVTKKDADNKLIPFEYRLHATGDSMALDIDMSVIKHPLIIADSGYLHQGRFNYTYYYSFTEMEIKGVLKFKDREEKISGKGWFDKQWGNFHPEVKEEYEWISIKLDNNVDINLWNIFDQSFNIPPTPTYRLFNCYIDDSTFFYTADFEVNRLQYMYSPDSSRFYCKRFEIVQPDLHIHLTATVVNPNCEVLFPFPFYEGGIVVEGTYGRGVVKGFGFAELLHTYEKPELRLLTNPEAWDISKPIIWTIDNPDEGRPVFYDLLISNKENSGYKYILRGTRDTFAFLNENAVSLDSSYSLMITARSVDTLLTDTLKTTFNFYPSDTYTPQLQDKIKVYPNPTYGQVFVNTGGLKYDLLVVTDGQGKIIWQQKANGGNTTVIDTKSLKAGNYYIIVYLEGKAIAKALIIHSL